MLTVRDFPLPRKTSFWPPSLFTTPYIVPPYEPPVFPRLISTTHTPTFSEWESSIRALSFDKVVLARKTTFTFDAPISPGALYHLLKKRSPNA